MVQIHHLQQQQPQFLSIIYLCALLFSEQYKGAAARIGLLNSALQNDKNMMLSDAVTSGKTSSEAEKK